MSEDQAVEAAKKYIDELKGIMQWALGIAFFAAVLGIQGTKVYKVLDLQLTRNEAFAMLSLLYVAQCSAVMFCVLRLSRLADCVASPHLASFFDRLSHYAPLVNPFASHSLWTPSGRLGHWGLTFQVIVFWLGLTSLYSIVTDNRVWLIDLLRGGNTAVAPVALPNTLAAYAREIGTALLYMAPVGIVVLIGYFIMLAWLEMPRRAKARAANEVVAARFGQLETSFRQAIDAGIAGGGLILIAALLTGAVVYR